MKMILKGPWNQLLLMLHGYKGRIDYACERASFELANMFMLKLLELAPRGDEYESYLQSMRLSRIGVRNKGAYAVVSDGAREKIGDILKRKTITDRVVIYVSPNVGFDVGPAVEVLMRGNPWPVKMLPSGIPRRGITLVHRILSEEEADWVATETAKFLAINGPGIVALGMRPQAIDDTSDDSVVNMESHADFMMLALRAEHRVNSDIDPHWTPALKWVVENGIRIIEKNPDMKRVFSQYVFRKHTMKRKFAEKEIDGVEFERITKAFRDKLRRA